MAPSGAELGSPGLEPGTPELGCCVWGGRFIEGLRRRAVGGCHAGADFFVFTGAPGPGG